MLIAVGVLAFLLFVWPGLYAYSTFQGKTYRTNRITGTTQEGSSEGWTESNGYRPSNRPRTRPRSSPWD